MRQLFVHLRMATLMIQRNVRWWLAKKRIREQRLADFFEQEGADEDWKHPQDAKGAHIQLDDEFAEE